MHPFGWDHPPQYTKNRSLGLGGLIWAGGKNEMEYSERKKLAGNAPIRFLWGMAKERNWYPIMGPPITRFLEPAVRTIKPSLNETGYVCVIEFLFGCDNLMRKSDSLLWVKIVYWRRAEAGLMGTCVHKDASIQNFDHLLPPAYGTGKILNYRRGCSCPGGWASMNWTSLF